MYKRIFSFLMVAVLFFSFAFVKQGLCYRIPSDDAGYLYVFGEDGKRSYGAKKEPQVIFLRVPKTYDGLIEISIYDPDVGGFFDEKSGKWNTETSFSIFGGRGAYTSIAGMREEDIFDFEEGVLLDVKDFGVNKKYDKRFYHFSPIGADEGEAVGKYRYFKIIAKGLSGDDNNMFSMEVSPDVAEAFAYTLALRLPERRGAKMMLYPEIARSVTSIIEENYDLDPTGGVIELISASKAYGVRGSGTGVWAKTKINVSPGDADRRWVYEITKDRQPNANMAMRLASGDGLAIPVFFTSGAAGPTRVFVKKPVEKPVERPGLACNTFTFDASKSHDPDNQELTYFWDFGDGTTSSQLRTMHVYKDAGKYLVKLTVTDNSEADCNTASTQQIVRVNQAPQAVAKGAELTCIDSEVKFDGSQSIDNPEDKLTYKWNFGDGEFAEGAKVAHRYSKGGNYQVALTVTDDSGTVCDTGMDRLGVAVNTPPVADAGKDIALCKSNPNALLEVNFDASKSKDVDGDRLSYIWDFGDGDTEEGKVTTHRYERGGEYVAKLMVTDNTNTNCNKSTATKMVKLNRSPMADAGRDLQLCVAETADFDASSSFDSDGDALEYVWDFGDGKTSTGKKVSHGYDRGGLYKVNLTVDDHTGTKCATASDSVVVDVNSTPNAELRAEEVGCVGKAIDFDASLSSDPDNDKLSYAWDFGDGMTATGANVRHSYEQGGFYKAVLSIDDGRGSNCSDSIKTHYVSVNTRPVASAGADLLTCVNNKIELDATKSFDSDKDSLTYTWDFGDGQTGEGVKVKHTYREIGIYKIVLTVTDDSNTECNVDRDSLIATVNAEPVPVIEVI